jgi:RNA polymerase sigma-70 factor (ECF subfamily)
MIHMDLEQVPEQADELAKRLAQDLDGHFEALVLTYQDRLYRFALRLMGNPQDAEEVAQDTLVRAYRALTDYSSDRVGALALRPWLYQITLNVVRNRVRRRRPQLVPLDGELPDSTEQEQPERSVEATERREELGALVAALPQRYRTAVVLRHIEDLRISEIAEVVGQPEGTVKSNIHRGIAMLRKAMDQEKREVLV